MDKVARKNSMMFFGGTAIVSAIAIFIFSVIFAAPQAAHAYAIGSVSPNSSPVPGQSATTAGGSYDVGGSFQNLISPFTNFFSSLKLNNNTKINTGGQTSGFPSVNLTTPAVSTGAQNILSQWLGEFDNWFYGISGVHLSGIFQVLLNAIAWTLGLAQRVVNWLLGLFH